MWISDLVAWLRFVLTMTDQRSTPAAQTPSSGSEEFGSVPNGSENFRTIPNHAEGFGTMPKPSERSQTTPQISARKENHTLTVREAARMFEAAGVARTERSIVNWCQANAQGIARLDAYFDPNERKYFITPQSVELAIGEEKAKAAKNTSSESVSTVPNVSEPAQITTAGEKDMDSARQIKDLEKEIFDLMITNRGKDFFIEQLQKEREGLMTQVVESSRKVGELETRLLQLGDGSQDRNHQ